MSKSALTILLALATLPALATTARAGELTKEECLDAHSRGQDAKEQNKLSLARKLFLTCAQPACPALVQGDCARFADELGRAQPSITFVARDSSGADLPDTAVYLDGALVATRMDGQPHDVDPGSHSLRFQNGAKEKLVTIVLGTGEKGRTVVATFASSNPQPGAAAPHAAGDAELSGLRASSDPPKQRPPGAKALLIGGSIVAAGGIGLTVYGISRVPSACSLSSARCFAAPGDPTFATASSAATTTDAGIFIGALGLAAIAGGAYWYVTGADHKQEKHPSDHAVVTPWVSPSSGGLAISGAL